MRPFEQPDVLMRRVEALRAKLARAEKVIEALLNPSEELREAVGRAIAEAMSDIQLGSHVPWDDLEFRRDAMTVADAALRAAAMKITGEPG